jgi:hypothetical protein
MNRKIVGGKARPAWLSKLKKQVEIIRIIEIAFDSGCDCEACQHLRAWSEAIGTEIPFPKEMKIDRQRTR